MAVMRSLQRAGSHSLRFNLSCLSSGTRAEQRPGNGPARRYAENQMSTKNPDGRDHNPKVLAADESARDSPAALAPPAHERRSSHRVADDQKSGQGSLSAMSKMQMILRRRAAMNPRDKEAGE